jgi:NAD(P)-dependent dehydrogenase (short-subunit alcohol dehydrogenase family)
MQFDGKVALVTGGATGIGQAAALAFARADPSEMSGRILHLCSDAASFTTGKVFVIDGGLAAV